MLCIVDLSWILNEDQINGFGFSSTFGVLTDALNQLYIIRETVTEIGQLERTLEDITYEPQEQLIAYS